MGASDPPNSSRGSRGSGGSHGAIMPIVAATDSWPTLGRLLADAFQDDPVWLWIAPDEERRRRHLGAMFAQLIRTRVRAGLSYTTGDLGGAAVWAAPGGWKISTGETLRGALPSLLAIGPRHFPRALRGLEAIEKRHPREPHWYLEFLAAHVDRRGQGYGSALIQPVLDRCDTEGLPAYLESSKPENLPFYNRFGFEVTGEFHLGSGSPPMWTMWREPR